MSKMSTNYMMTKLKNWILGKLGNITALIPSQASSSNKLADKAFVNSSIATATATFRGTYNLVSDLSLTISATQGQIATALASAISTADNNDYAFVQIPTSDSTPAEIARIDRYKYNGVAWAFEYSLNNSGFTAAQWSAINSGITSALVTKLGALPTNDALTTLLNGKEAVSNKVTSITEESTDAEYPSAKCVYDKIKAITEGDDVPALAENLESWSEDLSPVSNTWDETIRSTAGDDPIVTDGGGVIEMIRAKSDFKCTGLRTTAYNQLRLASNGGGAVAVGTGFYFPVPKLELGQFGDASYNNGLLLTRANGENIQNATVYFKPLASGVPTSVTDGTACSYETVTFGGKTYRTYVTSGEGWLIVSGIDYANTCAHLAWEDWYDKFVSPTDANDTGDYIALSTLFTAAPNGTGKFLSVGNVATYAERTDETHMLITDPIGRVTSPSWTNTLQEDGETYVHSLTISGMKTDGVAAIEGSSQILIVSGTTVSYSDTNATAISGAVRYEKATPAAATVTLGKTSYALNDCGVEVKEGAEGEGWMRCGYSQNIADALSQIAKFKLGDMAAVIAEALTNHQAALTTIVKMLSGEIYIPNVKVQTLETLDETSCNVPKVLIGAGAPNANNVPENMPDTIPWTGVPLFPAQEYFDKTNNKWYKAKVILNNAVSDWLLLN